MARRPPDDPLFVVPPARFTVERKRLAAEMRAGGAEPAARATEELRKPTVAVWAANQAARADRAGVDRLLQSVDRRTRAPGADGTYLGDADGSRGGPCGAR